MKTEVCFLLLNVVAFVIGQECAVNIPGPERRVCYPWPDVSQSACEDRGCAWCPDDDLSYPWCFYNDKACPSELAEGDRVECLSEGGGKDDCTAKGCIWCESETPGIPWCFADASVSQGGDLCPADVGYSPGELVDCYPEPDVTREQCLAKGCYWCPGEIEQGPWCYTPKEYGYRMVGEPVETPMGYEVNLRRVNYPSWFSSDVQDVRLEVEFISETALRMKFTDPNTPRFEVPVEVNIPDDRPASTLYSVEFSNEPAFNVKVVRTATGAVIFDSSIGGLTFSDQFLQIGTYLDSANIYGFGEEEHHSLRHSMEWTKYGMWTRDQAVTQSNLYGVQPFYMNVEESNAAHGVLFMNANAQDVTLQPEPALVYRTTGGILDIYMFLGPSPDEVVQQFTAAVGHPAMVPYWALGFQLCRWGYENIESMQEAVDRMRQYDIPHDVQYGDIDYMRDYLDFTIDDVNFAGLREYVGRLKEEGTRYVIILDPGISYTQPEGTYPTFDRGEEAGVWIMNEEGTSPAMGAVWPGPTYYPDFTNPATEAWWSNECVLFKEELDYAALWIDMNEPSNFTDIDNLESRCANNQWNKPQFKPHIDGLMYDKTLCMDTQQFEGMHYNVHSLYGWSMSKQSLTAARDAMPGLRSVVFSRSTFPGTGKYSHHWLGDNWSEWSNLKWSIIGMLEFNMFGLPYTGSDICGFIGEPTEEMCMRWQQLGSFYPFSRNHNAAGNANQDPGIWPEVARTTRETLHIRYRMLPYLYTLFNKVHMQGGTVIRPLFFEFAGDVATHGIDEQFMWGPAVMVAPVLFEGVRELTPYFPDARWFDYETGAEIPARGSTEAVSAPVDKIPVFFRGGHVIPTQKEANSTLFSRRNPMGLIVALDDEGEANGNLIWDDGEALDTFQNGNYFLTSFTVSDSVLSANVDFSGYDVSSLVVDDIEVVGVAGGVSVVIINGESHDDWSVEENQKLVILNAAIPLNSDFTVQWAS